MADDGHTVHVGPVTIGEPLPKGVCPSDEAGKAIISLAAATPYPMAKDRPHWAARMALLAVMPDGRTIAQHLDDGAVALFNAMGHDWHDAAAVVRDMFPTDALEAAAAKVQEAEG